MPIILSNRGLHRKLINKDWTVMFYNDRWVTTTTTKCMYVCIVIDLVAYFHQNL